MVHTHIPSDGAGATLLRLCGYNVTDQASVESGVWAMGLHLHHAVKSFRDRAGLPKTSVLFGRPWKVVELRTASALRLAIGETAQVLRQALEANKVFRSGSSIFVPRAAAFGTAGLTSSEKHEVRLAKFCDDHEKYLEDMHGAAAAGQSCA